MYAINQYKDKNIELSRTELNCFYQRPMQSQLKTTGTETSLSAIHGSNHDSQERLVDLESHRVTRLNQLKAGLHSLVCMQFYVFLLKTHSGDQGRQSTPQVTRSYIDITNLVFALVFEFLARDSTRLQVFHFHVPLSYPVTALNEESIQSLEEKFEILSKIQMEKLAKYISQFKIQYIQNINGYDSSFYLANL